MTVPASSAGTFRLPFWSIWLFIESSKTRAGFPENPRVSLSMITGKKTRSEGNIRDIFKRRKQ